jgi:hypothetical protein
MRCTLESQVAKLKAIWKHFIDHKAIAPIETWKLLHPSTKLNIFEIAKAAPQQPFEDKMALTCSQTIWELFSMWQIIYIKYTNICDNALPEKLLLMMHHKNFSVLPQAHGWD